MLRFEGTYNIPEWALCYLANGDRDNLTDEDVDMIYEFLSELPKGYAFDFGVTDEEKYGNWFANEFDPSPAFGLPCKTYDLPVWVETNEENKDFDIVIMDNNFMPESIEILKHRKFTDEIEAERRQLKIPFPENESRHYRL